MGCRRGGYGCGGFRGCEWSDMDMEGKMCSETACYGEAVTFRRSIARNTHCCLSVSSTSSDSVNTPAICPAGFLSIYLDFFPSCMSLGSVGHLFYLLFLLHMIFVFYPVLVIPLKRRSSVLISQLLQVRES